MNWIDINEKLPPDNDKFNGEVYIVTVICKSWERPETLIMNWETITIRNKFVRRWKIYNRIKDEAWIVTHWMELPKPATRQ